MERVFVLLVLLVLVSPSIKSELQSVNEDQACLHGSNDSSESCGSPMESNGSAQNGSPLSSSSSSRKEEAADDWSQPVPDGRCGRDARAAGPCHRLPAGCFSCQFNKSCVYGANVTVLCRPVAGASCTGSTLFNKTMVCSYCYQTPTWQHDCSLCNVMARGRENYRANCTVADNVLCMGRRTFHKSLFCKWTKGDRWGTALALSILLGGFGVDRFYLGHWQEAIGKFFSFGGLGVWTLIDVVLIAIGYLSPADGSLYIT